MEALKKDKQDTVSSASAFVSHLNTTRVMRWLNELHTDSGMHTHIDRQTQRVLFRQRGRSGDVAGLVTPIRERVTVGEMGDKRDAHCVG